MSFRHLQDITIGLAEEDRLRLAELARVQKRTKTDVAREAIRWYLDNYEQIKNQSRDGEIAQSIRYATDQIVKAILKGTNRICAMLARQGVAIGTLYELAWRASASEQAHKEFADAHDKAKQRQSNWLDKKEEKQITEKAKDMVTS